MRWFNGSTELAIYAFSPLDTFPKNILNDIGITINITNAIPESEQSENFNATSMLSSSTLALSMANIKSIQCGSRMLRSAPINLTVLNIQGTLRYYVFCVVVCVVVTNPLPVCLSGKSPTLVA